MIDICFVGNSSIDYISTKNGRCRTYGGSAIYSSLSCKYGTDKAVAIISNVDLELQRFLQQKGIEVFGNINEEMTTFEIDEENGTCQGIKYCNNSFVFSNKLDINHLHISFRKGVDFDSILNNPNINFKSLSIDVMIHSLNEMLPYILKYYDKIDYLFCNMKEYEILKDYITKIPYKIVTNEEKPVVVMTPKENFAFPVLAQNKIISSTGAGDTFIGGFLSSYIENQNLSEAVVCGIKNSFISLEQFGALVNSTRKMVLYNQQLKRLPKNIIVIGNSCAGKTTFIEYLKKYYNIYADIDDLSPLLETFMLDDESLVLNREEFEKLKNRLKFMQPIYEEYLANYNNIKHYSKKAQDNNGHDIIRPILWDMILERAVAVLHAKNNIIQFSRGKDELYEKEFGKNVYERSINSIINELLENEHIIIINLVSLLNTRKERNIERYKNGGHFVSEETMNTVYGFDYFSYIEVDNGLGYIEIKGKKYPVVTILNDKNLNEVELNQFLYYNLDRVINYYNRFYEEEENESKTITKRYLAKQIK